MSGLAVIDIGLNSRVPPTNSQWVNVYCVRICTCAVLGTARMCLLPAGHTALLACVYVCPSTVYSAPSGTGVIRVTEPRSWARNAGASVRHSAKTTNISTYFQLKFFIAGIWPFRGRGGTTTFPGRRPRLDPRGKYTRKSTEIHG